jgi:hypothetical protein
MKRILASLLILTMMAFALLSLTSCAENDGAPEGMTLVRGGEDVGYYFYGPEEWVVANLGDIACTYASKIDTSSMTFVESEKPEGTVKEYFESEKTKFPYEISVSVDGESCTFGNADTLATKYVYTYTYKEISYTCMQIFVTNGGRFYIFTYTASNVTYSEEKTYYQLYLDKIAKAIDAFKFTATVSTDEPSPEYERDADGYILVSDKRLAGFEMYVPDSYKVDYSTALVSVTNANGASITMSQATYTGVTNEDYWNARKANIGAFADKITDPESGESVSSLREIELAKQIHLEGTNWALVYEYTYRFEGIDYHVYQVLIVESAVNGYVFTYIASEEHYEEHLAEAKRVLEKIEY